MGFTETLKRTSPFFDIQTCPRTWSVRGGTRDPPPFFLGYTFLAATLSRSLFYISFFCSRQGAGREDAPQLPDQNLHKRVLLRHFFFTCFSFTGYGGFFWSLLVMCT